MSNENIDLPGLSIILAEELLSEALKSYKTAVEYDLMKYKLITDALGVALWDMDLADGDPVNPNNIFSWSQEFRRMLGFENEYDFPNVFSSWSERLHPDDKERVLEAFRAHVTDLTGKTPFNIEYRLKIKNGTYRDFHSFGTTMRDKDGVPVRSAGAIEDITDKKQTQAYLKEAEDKQRQLEIAEQASKTKSVFLANMSHEIRTPMNAIIGMTELLLSSNRLSGHDLDRLNDINLSAHALLALINDILDMSKIEAQKFELNPIHFNFKVFIDNEVSMMTYIARKKEIDFKYETKGDIPKYLFADDIRLRQVLTNICGNAIKFTEKGHVKLKITAEEIETPRKKTLIFEISDTGIGIPENDKPRLFHAFEQSTSEKSRYISGTGLGLVISKSFIELMGGKIEFDSKLGEGTVFTITIPVELGDGSKVINHEELNAHQTMCAPDAAVLVVDDNEFNLKVANGFLELFEIDTDTASSGIEAIEMVQNRDYDIVFMDHMMPDMDGVEAAAEIRKLGDKGKSLTIIALTANAVHGAREMFLENGFNGVLTKPLEISDMAKTLIEQLPPEKIKKKTGIGNVNLKDDENEKIGKFWESLAHVKKIDADIGLRYANGMKKMYHDNLKLFYEKLARNCTTMNTFVENNDFKNFAIAVHAIKSSLASIGAAELSDEAFRLERAAKNNDTEYCVSYFPLFFRSLLSLNNTLSIVFPQEQNVAREKGDAAYLKENIRKTLEAVSIYDNDSAIKIVTDLLEYDFGENTNNLLKECLMALKQYKYEEAQEILNCII